MIRIVGYRRLYVSTNQLYSYPRTKAVYGDRKQQKKYLKLEEKKNIDKDIIQRVWNPHVGSVGVKSNKNDKYNTKVIWGQERFRNRKTDESGSLEENKIITSNTKYTNNPRNHRRVTQSVRESIIITIITLIGIF